MKDLKLGPLSDEMMLINYYYDDDHYTFIILGLLSHNVTEILQLFKFKIRINVNRLCVVRSRRFAIKQQLFYVIEWQLDEKCQNYRHQHNAQQLVCVELKEKTVMK